MLAKLALLAQSKVAIAALGVVLVGGGGTAVAVAATTGHLPFENTQTESTQAESTHEANNDQGTPDAGDHAHTVSFEGALTKCQGTPATSIVITLKDGKSQVIAVNSKTRIVGELDEQENTSGQHEDATKTTSSVPAATTTTSSLSDLCKTSNYGHKVQASTTQQADKSYLAWKVAISNAVEKADATEEAHGTPAADQHEDIEGMVASAPSGSSFTVKESNGKTVTVTVTSTTVYAGKVHSLADVKSGMQITVAGTAAANGTITATRVEAESTGA